MASQPGTSFPLNLFLIAAAGSLPGGEPQNNVFAFDPTNFNDVNNGSFYNWKVEDVACGRTPTIDRIFISYRDLGVAQITLTLTGTNDLQEVVSESNTLQIGNTSPTGRIMTVNSGIPALTAQNLQLSLVRAPNGGPVSITKIRMEGRVETTVYG